MLDARYWILDAGFSILDTSAFAEASIFAKASAFAKAMADKTTDKSADKH